MPTQAVRRLERWCASSGATLERLRYPRPAAGGEVSALRLTPAAPARARVVAAHGAGNDALFPLVALFKALVGAGCEVFAFDLDGNGRESTTVFSPETVASALPDAVRVATEDRATLPLHLVGHSYGGSLTLHALASGELEAADSAVVISSPLDIDLTWAVALGEVRGFLRAETLAQREHYGLWGVLPAFGPVKRRDYPFRGPEAPGRFGYVEAVRRSLWGMDLEGAAARLRHPVLLVYSRADRLVPPVQGERLARAIPGAELLLLDRPAHYGVPFAEEAVRRIRDWVTAPPSPAAACAD